MTGLPRLGRRIPAPAADGGRLGTAHSYPQEQSDPSSVGGRMGGVRDSALLDSSSAYNFTPWIASPLCLTAGLPPVPNGRAVCKLRIGGGSRPCSNRSASLCTSPTRAWVGPSMWLAISTGKMTSKGDHP